MINSTIIKSENNAYTIRDTLFRDLPISAWNGNNSSEEPWLSFQEVQDILNQATRRWQYVL
jgi:hypothetical protein